MSAAEPMGRADLVAALNSMSEPAPAAPDVPAPATEEAATPPAAVVADPPAEPAAEVEATEAEGLTPPADAAKPDPELAKRLEAVQRAEKRAKEEIARAKAELEAERKKLDPDLAELKELRDLVKRARMRDPDALLKLADAQAEDAEDLARGLFRMSPKARENPANRDEVARTVRERELAAKAEAALARADEAMKRLADYEANERNARESAAYFDATSKAVSDETPVLRSMLERNPTLARQRIQMARDYFYQQTGEVPEPADLLRELEQVERNELVARGIDPDVALKSAPSRPAPVANRPAGKTLSNDLTKSTSPRPDPKTPEEEKADLLKALESGQFD